MTASDGGTGAIGGGTVFGVFKHWVHAPDQLDSLENVAQMFSPHRYSGDSVSRIDGIEQRRAFAAWLRTGRLPTVSDHGVELKFNPWHDPDDGQFTHAGAGRHFGKNSAPSADRRSDNRPKVSAPKKRVEPPSRGPLRKVAEFADGVVDGVYDVGKQTAADMYDAATTNPVTTIRNFGEGVARRIDAALVAEDTPARIQVQRAATAIASASPHDLGHATGQIIGNAGLAAVPGAAATRISAVRRLRAARPRKTFHPPSITWRKETIGKEGPAKIYNDTAKGARANQAPALMRTMPNGAKRPVKFDGIDGDYLIDRKWKVVDRPHARAQVLRQSEALLQNKQIATWEVPNNKQRRDALKFLNKMKAKNIKIRIVKP